MNKKQNYFNGVKGNEKIGAHNRRIEANRHVVLNKKY